jgi:hypothetical protein
MTANRYHQVSLSRRTKLKTNNSCGTGPPRTFSAGDVFQVSKIEPWKVYAQWSDKWGEFIINNLEIGRH